MDEMIFECSVCGEELTTHEEKSEEGVVIRVVPCYVCMCREHDKGWNDALVESGHHGLDSF